VTSWEGLNSSQTPSVTLREYTNGSTVPYATYGLTNGANGPIVATEGCTCRNQPDNPVSSFAW